MGEVTLNVPAEYAEQLRLAVVTELGWHGDWVKGMEQELSTRLVVAPVDGVVDEDPLADVRGASRALAETLKVAEQLFPITQGAVELRGEADALSHTAETMARKFIAPEIAGEAATAPIDGEAAARIERLTRALGWAAGEAARLHELAVAEIKARKVGAA